jgi:hypothetical protein
MDIHFLRQPAVLCDRTSIIGIQIASASSVGSAVHGARTCSSKVVFAAVGGFGTVVVVAGQFAADISSFIVTAS